VSENCDSVVCKHALLLHRHIQDDDDQRQSNKKIALGPSMQLDSAQSSMNVPPLPFVKVVEILPLGFIVVVFSPIGNETP